MVTMLRGNLLSSFSLGLMSFAIISLVASVSGGLFHFSQPRAVLDSNSNYDNLEEIVEQICYGLSDRLISKSNYDKVISRPSTVLRISKYFNEIIEAGDNLNRINCAKIHAPLLNNLREIIETRKDNVCSSEKVTLISNFHRKYLSTVLDDKSEETGHIPKIIKTFFMHYAMEVSAICKKSLLNNLEFDLAAKQFDNEDFNGKNSVFDQLFGGLANTFTSFTKVRNYNDIVLFWDLIDGSLLQKESSAFVSPDNGDDSLKDKFGEPIKMLVKTKFPEPVLDLQLKCRNRYRPVYEKLILPIVSLADLGYSWAGENLNNELEELQGNELLKRWYLTTQICETLLPILILKDSSLEDPKQLVIVTKSEAEELEASEAQPEVDVSKVPLVSYEPSTNVFEDADHLGSIESLEARELIYNLKLNLGKRDRVIRRVLSRFGSEALQFARSKLSAFLPFSRRTNKSDDEYEEYEQLEEAPDGAAQASGATEIGDDRRGGEKAKKQRRKREISSNRYKRRQRKNILAMADEQLNELKKNIDQEGKYNSLTQHHMTSALERRSRHDRSADLAKKMQDDKHLLSYQHSMSWAEIWEKIHYSVVSLAPNRMTIFILGSLIVIILVVLIFLTLTAAAPAAAG